MFPFNKLKSVKRHIFNFISTPSDEPIIILGNQKSGTSVITHLVADYGGLSKTVDIPAIWGDTLRKLKKDPDYFYQFVRKNAWAFSKEVIKEPNLTHFYPQLCDIYPNAQFVFIIRDPRSNIRSWLNRMSLAGNLKNLNNNNLENTPDNWIIFDKDLRSKSEGNYVEVLAWRWVKCARVYLENKSDFRLVRYEDFNSNKLNTIKKIADDLRVQGVNDISKKVDIQYQPRGSRNVGWEEFFGKKNLMRIEKICTSYMKKFGYEPVLTNALG